MRQQDLGDEDGWMLGSVQNLQMTWALVAFYAALAVLAHFAMVGRTPTRRLFSAIGIIAVQMAAFVWIQITARALGSQSHHGSYSLGVSDLYLARRPILLFNAAVCIALVLVFLAALTAKKAAGE